jgi:alkanesulfonate monooxygenase SsuD/methylene tetrahydromethanopterin reductase-like flavin-dependent oxidoreductase (luciferase family)
MLSQAVALYRAGFRRSEQLERPYVMLGINVFAADSDDEAQRLFTSLQQAFVSLRLGRPGRLPPPVAGYGERLGAVERSILDQALSVSIVGTSETVRRRLDAFVEETGADELMVTSQIFNHAARLRSFEITAGVRDALTQEHPATTM